MIHCIYENLPESDSAACLAGTDEPVLPWDLKVVQARASSPATELLSIEVEQHHSNSSDAEAEASEHHEWWNKAVSNGPIVDIVGHAKLRAVRMES